MNLLSKWNEWEDTIKRLKNVSDQKVFGDQPNDVTCLRQDEVPTPLYRRHYPRVVSDGLHGDHRARWRPYLDTEWRPEIQ